MTKSDKLDNFVIFVDDEYLMNVRCTYGEVLDLIWPLHFNHPEATINLHVVNPED